MMDKIASLITSLSGFPELVALFTAAIVLVIRVLQQRAERRAREKVDQAEGKVFVEAPKNFEKQLGYLTSSQATLEEKTQSLKNFIDESQNAVRYGYLFKLYSSQIEQYQQETRFRAFWSFLFGIVSMMAGLGFVLWGGATMINGNEATQLAAGASISAIGGAVGGYIAKTFLNVHRLSISQLNRYFQQPVINDHILMAQRLADDVGDGDTRKQAYKNIITSISQLIASSADTAEIEETHTHPAKRLGPHS